MSPQPATPAAQQAMQDLTAQWYNAVVSACKLDPSTFQLAQGFPVLETTSTMLWAMLDALPPHSVTQFWNPAQFASFASNYAAVVMALTPPQGAELVTEMGDYYTEWMTYKKGQPIAQWPAGGVLELFHQWELQNMPDAQGQRAYSLYSQLMQNPINIAIDMWVKAGGGGATMAYNTTVEILKQQLAQAAGGNTVHMDSTTSSKDLSHAWAKGKVGGLFDFFSGSGSANWDDLTTEVAQAGVTIDATFNRLLTYSFGPLEKPVPDNPILAKYKPWYYSAALGLGYQAHDELTWSQPHPTREETFGPSGTLSSIKTGLVLVSGLKVTLRSAVSFSNEQRQTVSASAKLGFFPFFSAEASGGWHHEFKFDDAGGMTVTSTVPESATVVLGAIVTPAASIYGG
jgi:hypothetical protein